MATVDGADLNLGKRSVAIEKRGEHVSGRWGRVNADLQETILSATARLQASRRCVDGLKNIRGVGTKLFTGDSEMSASIRPYEQLRTQTDLYLREAPT
jgi:hypothetical protein